MREIKFRGRDEQGRWHFGMLRVWRDQSFAIETTQGLAVDFVDPATVGQYTGLKDITDTEIFEGDIVDFFHEWHGINGEYCSKEMRGVVVYECAGFDVITRDRHSDESFWELYMLWQSGSVQVIGNIYNNPELLTEVKE